MATEDLSGKIVSAGTSLDNVVIQFKGAVLPDLTRQITRWFTARPTAQKEILATALSAIATGYECFLRVEDLAEWSEIQMIRMGPGA